jgi:D-lactate dehydrogenase (cytochrome)
VTWPGVPAAPYTLVWTVEGLAEDVAAECEALQAALQAAGAPTTLEVKEQTAASLWAEFVGTATLDELLVRIGAPPGRLLDYWQQLPAAAHSAAVWCWDVGNSLAYAACTAVSPDAAATWLETVRRPALSLGGYVLALQTPAAWRSTLDPLGYRPAARDLMAELKRRWDPALILNPGDFIDGR